MYKIYYISTLHHRASAWAMGAHYSVEERNSRHGSGGFSPERGGDSRQCDLDPSPVNFLTKIYSVTIFNRF